MAKDKLADATIELSVSGLNSVKAQLRDVSKLAQDAAQPKGKGGATSKAKEGADALKNLGGKGGGNIGDVLGKAFGGGGNIGKMLGSLKGMGPAMAAVGVAAAVVAVAVAAVGAAIAGLVVGLKTVVGLLKVADPVRFAQLGAKLEVSQIILGRQFIPLLQVAVRAVDKLNSALRGMANGGLAQLSKILANTFGRMVDAVMPHFIKAVQVADKFFRDLAPHIQEIADIVEEVFNAELGLDFVDNVLKPLAAYVLEIIKGFAIWGRLIWDTFGSTAGAQALLAALNGVLYVLTATNKAANDLGEALKAGFQAATVSIIAMLNELGAALNKIIDVFNEILSFEFALREGVGKIPQIDRFKPIKTPNFDDKKKPKKPEEKGLNNNPLQIIKPEFTAIDEIFRKANTSSQNDPAKEAERERKAQADKLIQVTERIATNTERPAPALAAY